jgi:UDP-N-acetylmuramate--alanine ligase
MYDSNYKLDFDKPCHIYFIGIGGISMSGLAEILLSRGFKVTGSDISDSVQIERLRNKGAKVFIGQKIENIIENIDIAVYTAAVKTENPEYAQLSKLNVPLISRADLLGQMMSNYETAICISGTHGKTTVTSMLTQILLEAKMSPTVSVGGMLDCIGGNIHIGKSEIFVTEACEYTNSFLSFYPTMAAILNVKEDHVDFFKDIEDIRNSFKKFAKLLPDYGVLAINNEIDNIEEIIEDLDCNVAIFGIEKDEKTKTEYDYTAKNVTYNEQGNASFQLFIRGISAGVISLSVLGEHNVKNALAAIAMAYEVGVEIESIKSGLLKFRGTERRFQKKGIRNGFVIIDDYAHHPDEIKVTLEAAKKYPHKKLWCIFQPHTYSRTKAFLEDFGKTLALADEVILAKIYPAREINTLGVSSKDVMKEVEKNGVKAHYFEHFEEIEKFILENCKENDMLITMGAGNVVDIGEMLLKA